MKKRMLGIIALGVACVLAGSGLTMALTPAAVAEENITTTIVTSPFTAAVAQVKDSVVGINNYQKVRYSNSYGNWGNWGDYFGFGDSYGGSGRGNNGGYTEQEVKASTGSGVVIADGYVLTNSHVVEDASTLKVAVMEESGDIEEYASVLVAQDENLDIAILYAPDLKLMPVTLGDSDTLMVGDWAICIGNPLGDSFFGTVTAGIVSALNRSVSSSSYDKYGRKETITNTMIQVDAAINNGNSGGGMFSASGELMGIPTLKYSGSAYSGASIDGIGMCIPINAAKPLIDDVLSGSIATPAMESEAAAAQSSAAATGSLIGKPRMGVTISGMTNVSSATVSAVMNGSLPNGLYVSNVEAGSPAEQAGMQVGDIIVECEGEIITTTSQLQNIIAGKNEGDALEVIVFRAEGLSKWVQTGEGDVPDGDYETLTVVLSVVDAVRQ